MTYSLAGRCTRTGMMGAAITTSSLAVGSRCAHARAGLGVVLTQHRTDPRLGPRGLMLLESGYDPAAVVAALVASTPDAGWRQLAVLDRHGAAAHFSGAHIRSPHGGVTGPGCVAVDNILANPAVPAAMVAAFAAAPGLGLPERLLAALEAGDKAGGESRPSGWWKPAAPAAVVASQTGTPPGPSSVPQSRRSALDTAPTGRSDGLSVSFPSASRATAWVCAPMT